MRLARLLVLLAFLGDLEAAGGNSLPPDEKKQEEEEREKARKSAPDPLAQPLEERIRSKNTSDYVIDVSWPIRPGILGHCRIYGDGIGLWYGAKQFSVDKSKVLSLMKTTRRIRFGAFPLRVGGEEEEGKEEREIQARISVRVGDLRHVVLVLGEEKPDKELEELARAVLAIGTKAEKRGVTIGSLNEGIEKLASGVLAPQTLEVLAQRTTSATAGPEPAENWILIASGKRIRDREVPRGKVATSERVFPLTDAEFRELLSLLKENKVSDLPRNLYSERYSRLRIQILNQVATVEARRFSGMSPETNPEARTRFDRVWQWCEKQRSRALASGRDVSLSMQADSEPPEDERD
jgi:hypothetical protein